jgi:soluble lytic murein transglycosylase-like protein
MSRYGQLILMAILIPWFHLKPAQVVVPTPDPYQNVEFRTALFEASRVYGKGACGDAKLAEMTARNAIRTGLPANLIASIVVIESTCNPLAINKTTGDVGIMQIDLSAQGSAYDFQSINPFNPERNMEMGSNILAASVRTYGVRKGVGRYNGVGPNMDIYSARVLAMAGPLRK